MSSRLRSADHIPFPTIGIVLLIVALRLVGLGSYPPAMPDEGFWVSGPRNWVLFGSPLMDGRLHSFLSPATLWDPLESTCRHASLSIL